MGLLSAVPLLLFLLSGTAADGCQNGGFLLPDNSCNCPPMWTGGDCSTIVCLNGGYVMGSNKFCTCPSGYMGVHCDAVTTFNRPLNAFPPQKTSFNLVLVNIFSNYWGGLVYSQFKTSLSTHLNTTTPKYDSINFLTNTAGAPSRNSNTNAPSVFNFTNTPYDNVGDFLTADYPKMNTPGTYQCYQIPFYQNIVDLIQKNNLRETAITIFTQHPALSDSDSYNRIIELATSFNIRINVIWSDDDTFVRCTSDVLTELRNLAKVTGGMFVFAQQIETYDVQNPIIDVVLASHYRYEAVVMDFSKAPSVSFYMNPPYTKKYYVVALTDDGLATKLTWDNSSCTAIQGAPIESGSVAQAAQVTGIATSCKVTVTATVGEIRLLAFGSDFSGGPISVRLFKSYVETPQIDSSNTQPDQGNSLYLSLHIENNPNSRAQLKSAVFHSATMSPDLNINITQRSNAVFEWISKETITCTEGGEYWIELAFSASSYPETRIIPINCVNPTVPARKPAPVVKSWWTPMEEHFDNDFIETVVEEAAECPGSQPKALILAYSDTVSFSEYNSFVLTSIPTAPISPYNYFGEVRFDVKLPATPEFNSQNGSYSAFNDAVQNTYGWDDSVGLDSPMASSQVLSALQSIATSTDLQQNSLVSVLLSRLPDISTDLTPYYNLVNKNVKVVFFMDIGSLDNQLQIPGKTADQSSILNQIAAITSGHFIVSDQTSDSGIDQFRNIVNTVYTSGPGQNLLLAKNIKTPKMSDIIGNIDLSNIDGDVNVTLTLSTAVLGNGTTATIPIPVLKFSFVETGTTFSVNRLETSNFYTATTTLSGGTIYNLKVVQLLYTNPVFVRVWTNTKLDSDVQITYKALDDTTLSNGPDDFEGAALAVNLFNATQGANMSLSITDCSGVAIQLYDASQKFQVSKCGDVRFIPFFCSQPQDISGCQAGTERLYFAQITSDTVDGFAATKTFMCPKSTQQPVANCQNQDAKGNKFCGGNTSPYTRGPSGKLIDCSDPFQSDLKYDKNALTTYNLAPYSCDCPADQGPSCEKAVCNTKNTNGGAIDTQYRTYSVVLGIDSSYAGGPAGYLFSNAEKVLSTTAANIWQYQLLAACYGGQVFPLYIGTSADDFKTAFGSYNNAICSGDYQDFNLTSVFSAVVSSLGRPQRGLTVFYHELSAPGKVDVPDLEAFVEIAQQYKQQVFVYNAYEDEAPSPITDNLKKSVMMTGGVPIFRNGDGDDDTTQFFTTILSQSTSLNAHEPFGKPLSEITMDADGYLIIGSDKDAISSAGSSCGSGVKMSSKYTIVCPVQSGGKVSLSSIPSSAWYSVISNGNSPVGTFINQRVDDSSTALAVSYTTGGPTLAIAPPAGWTVTQNLDGNARMAQRQQCTFVETTVNVFESLQPGYNSITVSISDGTRTVNKVFPFGVSRNIACVNGLNSPYYPTCSCGESKQWTGPDCSTPVCNSGDLSTWGNACVCRGKGGKGQFCNA